MHASPHLTFVDSQLTLTSSYPSAIMKFCWNGSESLNQKNPEGSEFRESELPPIRQSAYPNSTWWYSITCRRHPFLNRLPYSFCSLIFNSMAIIDFIHLANPFPDVLNYEILTRISCFLLYAPRFKDDILLAQASSWPVNEPQCSYLNL